MKQPDVSELYSLLITNPHRSGLAITGINGTGVTYSELNAQILRTHHFLRIAGIRPADTIALSLRNGPETAALIVALLLYCSVAPLNPGYTAREVEFVLHDVKARAIILREEEQEHSSIARQSGALTILLAHADQEQPGSYMLHVKDRPATTALDAQPPPAPDSIALLLHTSGTTARPKLVPLTHRNLTLSARGVANVLELSAGDRCLSIMPLFHIHGLVAGLLASLVAGATVCCAPGFQATSFFGWLDSSRATWYTAVPTMHQTILSRARHNPETLARHRLRLIRSSSSPLYSAVWHQLERVFDVPVLNAYGMTEAAHQITSVRLPGGPKFQATVGCTTGLETAIMDSAGKLLCAGEIGEVVLRGEQITPGYLAPPGANQTAFHNGWFRTGDEGMLDAQGLLTLTGRLKEMINSGGEKISPYEVEEALLRHPGISQAVAFAQPHDLLGEQVAAAVVVRDGFTVPERELLQLAGQHLAKAKMPRQLLFVAEIPPGATGKLQRIGLAARFSDKLTKVKTMVASNPDA